MRTDLLRVPSGTALRFAALVALAVATTVQIFGQYAAVWPVRTSLDDARCQVRADLYLTSASSVDPDAAKWSAYRECMAAFLVPRLAWLAGGLVLLFAVALVIYLARPGWRLRRSRLVALDGALADELADTLAELVARAGLRKAPEFVLDPASFRAGGVAFGHHRRKIVCLDAGLVALHRRDPASFRAIVLHELAHVRADVTTTYATLAVWRAFLVAVLAPYLLTLVNPWLLSLTPWRITWPDVDWSVGWRLVVMVVLVYLARIAVLRSREKYADALVVQWTGDDDPYRNLVPTRTIRRWLAVHPTRAARQVAMRNPESLLRPGFWEVLASALALQVAWWHAVASLRELTWYREGNESFTVMRAVWALVVAALVASIAWRGAAAPPRRGVFAVPGLALGLGFVLGDVLDAQNRTPATWFGLLAWVLLVVTAVLVCCWAGYCARLASGRRVFFAAALAVVCYSTLGWFTEARVVDVVWRDNLRPVVEILHGYASSTVDIVVLDVVSLPFLLNFHRVVTAVALLLLWLVPIVLRRSLPRFALMVGGAGGLVALSLLGLWGSVESPPSALVRTAWGIVLVFVVQLGVAIVVARRTDRIGALLAAWIVGLLGGVGIWWGHLDGTQVDSVLATRPQQVLPFLGTVAALLGGLSARTAPARSAKPWGVLVIAVVSVGLVWWWPKAEGAAPLEPPVASAEPNHDQAVNIWIYGGGWDTFMTVMNAQAKVFDGVRANDERQMLAGCDGLLPVLRDAAAFPKPPEDRVRAAWTEAVTSLESGARECVRVVRDRAGDAASMGDHFLKGVNQLGATQTLLVEAQERAVS